MVVVVDGIRQEGQQWGDEHGIEVDASTVDKVEILKGPASLAYGSDALAGVVNLIPAASLPEGNIKGQIFSNYQSNNGLMDSSANCSGNVKGVTLELPVTVINSPMHTTTGMMAMYIIRVQGTGRLWYDRHEQIMGLFPSYFKYLPPDAGNN